GGPAQLRPGQPPAHRERRQEPLWTFTRRGARGVTTCAAASIATAHTSCCRSAATAAQPATRSTNRSAGSCMIAVNGSASTIGCSESGKKRTGTTKPPRNITAAPAMPPRPRASVVQNADRLSRKRQPKLTTTASSVLSANASQAPGEEGQCSPKRTCPHTRIGNARNATKYAARPRSRASQKPRYENGLLRSETTSPVRIVSSTSHQPHSATIMIIA